MRKRPRPRARRTSSSSSRSSLKMSCWNSYDVIRDSNRTREGACTRGRESFTGACASLVIWHGCNGVGEAGRGGSLTCDSDSRLRGVWERRAVTRSFNLTCFQDGLQGPILSAALGLYVILDSYAVQRPRLNSSKMHSLHHCIMIPILCFSYPEQERRFVSTDCTHTNMQMHRNYRLQPTPTRPNLRLPSP